MQDSTEVVGRSIARTSDVELLLNEKLGLERHIALGIADADHTSGERNGIDGRDIRDGRTDSFNHHVSAHSIGVFHHLGKDILLGGVDAVGCASLNGKVELLLAQIHSNDGGSTLHAANDGTQAHHATTEDEHDVDVRHLATAHGMESNRHRFDEGGITWGDVLDGDDLLPRQGNIFAHGTIALHTKCLVVLAGIETSVAAGGTMAAVGIGIDSDHLTNLEVSRTIGADCLDYSANLMTRNDVGLGHGVAAKERVEVAAAKTDILEPKQHFARTSDGLWKVDDLYLL